MTDKTFYAVVDLETTGSQPSKGDRIIQFGCVLIQDGEIVQTFETTLNPLKKIPEHIQHLTGITNQMVSNAPFFNDVAGFIWNLLQDCVFVAHNVLFDFRFLNEELKRAGFPELTIPAIDTVELGQILFPKEDSYSLSDLSESLGLSLERPHDALEDAKVTAELLLTYAEKAKRLPLVTLEQLKRLSSYLTMETSLFFDIIAADVKANPGDLPEQLMVVEGLALRSHLSDKTETSYRQEKTYPFESVDKAALFNGTLSVRQDQEEMMNAVYHYFLEPEPSFHMAIEAPSGIGKSLGYLLPSVFLASKEQPVVISTHTTLLQQQLLEKDLDALEDYLPFPVQAAVLKSRSHYLSLEKFVDKLSSSTLGTGEALYCSKILVWLTETATGDLDELGVANDRHSFWNEVRTTKRVQDFSASKWAPYEFYRLSRERLNQSSIIVTNHSFLCHDLARDLPEMPQIGKIIIDEAHHLPKAATEAATRTVDFRKIRRLLQTIGAKEDDQSLLGQLNSLLNRVNQSAANLNTLDMSRTYVENELREWIEEWLFTFRDEVSRLKEKNERVDIAFETTRLSMPMRKQAKTVMVLMQEIVYLLDRILEGVLKTPDEWTKSERQTIEQTYVVTDQLSKQADVLKHIFRSPDAGAVHWMSFLNKHPLETFRLIQFELESRKFLEKTLGQIPHVVYTSGTLSVNDEFAFFESQVGTKQLEKLRLSAPYDYAEQARVWIPKNLPPIKGMPKQEYVEMLVEYILSICQQSEENALVLFNSLETLELVYNQLLAEGDWKGRELFAQGFSGSRERMLKRFFRAKGAVLLGADSFWEGIDLPGKSLKIAVVTRLPFESPDRPLVQARQQMLKKQHKNPFSEDSLPRAVVKMKQGFGRLIRSPEDKGVMIVLDDRFLNSTYAKQFQQALPADVPIEEIDMAAAAQKLKEFFDT